MDSETKTKSFKVVSSLIFIFVLSPVLMLFQNCGGGPAMDSGSNSSASTASSITVYMPPQNTIGYVGEGATFTVGATQSLSMYGGVIAPLTYQWKRNGTLLAGKTSSSLVLSNLQTSDAGQYSVVISRAADNYSSAITVESTAGTLTVQSVPAMAMAPTIVTQTVSTVFASGGNYFHRVQVDGYPRPTVHWYKDGTDTGITGETVPLPSVGSGYNGVYYAVISNLAGSITSNPVMIAVDQTSAIPVIVDSTPSGSAPIGSTVEMYALAAGIESPRFQWYKGTTPISGATQSTYTISNFQASHAGDYSFVATNSAGATSVTATLTAE